MEVPSERSNASSRRLIVSSAELLIIFLYGLRLHLLYKLSLKELSGSSSGTKL